MSSWTRTLLALVAVTVSFAQEPSVDLRGGLKINLPKDAPVAVAALDLGPSRATVRGGAVMVDLRASLRLRNLSGKVIKGVTLLVVAQDVTPGGKGSVAVPALHVPAGEEFPIRIDMRMMRPASNSGEPLVQVRLDGVLFDDMSFFGEDRLHSRRQLTVWELEANRDRRFLRELLEAKGPEGLQREMVHAVARLEDRPRVDVQVVRQGRMPRATNLPATNYEMEREVEFSFLRLPGAPVDVMAGAAHISGDQARAPKLDLRNREERAIRYVELGLILKELNGREFYAARVPHDALLGAKRSAELSESATLRVRGSAGTRITLGGMSGFVHTVEFADGEYWIPSREELSDSRLGRLIPPSPEEQRLVQIYRRRGLQGLIDELKR